MSSDISNSSPALFIAFVGAALTVTTCLEPAPRSAVPETSATVRHTIVIVAMDGVRSREIFEGVERERAEKAGLTEADVASADELVPNLRWIVNARGSALGAPQREGGIRASGPEFISLPGYAEMLSGRAPASCRDNSCARTTGPTLADELAALPSARLGDVAVIASWPLLERAAVRNPLRTVVSAGRIGGL